MGEPPAMPWSSFTDGWLAGPAARCLKAVITAWTGRDGLDADVRPHAAVAKVTDRRPDLAP